MMTNWTPIILASHGLSFIFLLLLFIFTVRKKDKKPDEKAFLILMSAFLCWIFFSFLSHGFAVLTAPSKVIGYLGGFSVIYIGISALYFCELFPGNMRLRHWRLRMYLAWLVSFPVALLIFSEKWISNRRWHDGVISSEYGPYFYVTSLWTLFMIVAGFVILFIKYFKTRETRKKTHIKIFLLGAFINLALTSLFSFILPVIGYDKLFFLGPDAALIFISLIIYATIFHQLFDLKTATLRIIMRLGLSVIISAAFYFIYLLVFLNQNILSVSLYHIVALSFFFILGILYNRFLQNKIDSLFFPQILRLEDLILNLIDKRHLTSGNFMLDRLLQTILDTLSGAIGFDNGAFIASDQNNRLHTYALKNKKPQFSPKHKKLILRIQSRKNIPEPFLDVFNKIILLEIDAVNKFSIDAKIRLQYPAITRAAKEILAILEKESYRILIPLVYQKEICGFLLLGEKSNQLPYYSHDLKMLDAIRAFITMSLRNQIFLEEIQMEKVQAEEEVNQLAKYISEYETTRFTLKNKTLTFQSRAMNEVFQKAQQSSNSSHPVLITGETGTGKELIAHLIHDLSDRKQKPYVVCNSAAIPSTLWEDEVFGHIKGAYTDARKDRPGLVASASDGTLFFDEIGEIPLEMQPKLLRLLQERQYTPIGGSKTQQANCRFIFATNRDLDQMQKEGSFRPDLFYRINVLPIHIPPLRERKEDIVGLVEHFGQIYKKDSNLANIKFELDALDLFFYYDWPGNVRELENVIIRILARVNKEVVTAQDIPLWGNIKKEKRSQGENISRQGIKEPLTQDVSKLQGNYEELINDYARSLISYALKRAKGNKTKAAQILGIKWGRLNYQIKELKID